MLDEHRPRPALRRGAQRPKGLREGASGNWGRTVTLISSITLAGIGANRSVVDEHRGFGRRGVLPAFSLYLKEVLLWPTLKRGQIVVMDNLSVHKSTRVSDLVEQRGCELWFLPAYSPDLNPTEEAFSREEAFSKAKGALKRAKARRTLQALFGAIGRALGTVTADDARGLFGHRAYATPQAH